MKLDWKQVLVALILGIALGVFGTLRAMPFGAHGRFGGPKGFHQHIMEKFNSKLNLTSDQQQKVSAILKETRIKIGALREEMGPRFQEIKNSSRVQIRTILTPGQQKKFDAMTAEMDSRFKNRRSRYMKDR